MEAIDNQENTPVSGSDAQDARRARVIAGTDVVECMTGEPICHWGFTFGDMMFCNHPSSKMIAEGILSKDCPAIFSLP